MRILFVGPLRQCSSTDQRLRALRSLGHEVDAIDLISYLACGSRILLKVQRHLLAGPGVVSLNRTLLSRAWAFKPDIIWLESGGHVWRDTIKNLRATGGLLLNYNTDYLKYRRYSFRHYLKALDLYDVHATTNELNVQLLKQDGARKVVRTHFGYDPNLHRPVLLSGEDNSKFLSEALFVGHWEPTTEQMILYLENQGIHVGIWGTGWNKVFNKRLLNGGREIHPIFCEEYVKALAATKIGLCFLSKWNRNQSAGRTFEIPAVGAILLAERTADHMKYYIEGEEAEFFSTPKELVQKARYYLEHESERKKIAEAGHERCVRSSYTYQDRVRQILEELA